MSKEDNINDKGEGYDVVKKYKEILSKETSLEPSYDDDLKIQSKYFKLEKEEEENRDDLKLRNIELEYIITLRNRWSNWLLGVIVVIIVVDLFIMISVGFGWMTYTKTHIIVFIFESILKIVGLAYIVVNFLFDKNTTRKRIRRIKEEKNS